MNKNQLSTINSERYGALDGLRAYAAIGIVLMHVLGNISVKPSSNYLTDSMIPWFTDFTLMFMVVSGFSLCCGYYDIWKDILVVLQRERFVFAQLDWKFVHFDIICQRHYLTSLATAQNFVEECAPLKFYPLTGEILLFGGDYNHTIGCVERYRNGVHVISLRHAA